MPGCHSGHRVIPTEAASFFLRSFFKCWLALSLEGLCSGGIPQDCHCTGKQNYFDRQSPQPV